MQSFMGITSTVSSPLPSSPPASATESRVSTIVIIPGKKKLHIFLPSLFQAMILTSKFSWESIKELLFSKYLCRHSWYSIKMSTLQEHVDVFL